MTRFSEEATFGPEKEDKAYAVLKEGKTIKGRRGGAAEKSPSLLSVVSEGHTSDSAQISSNTKGSCLIL